ncbi:MAG TPA: UbiA family prenyltransferase [Dongiaceae bacterium]|jgi:4-hydroxybenzoate polyprenyltransferase|nr:UbiA family prenyltransferase [Dongiaceae bacterium]
MAVPLIKKLRALLVLGRISNLPTVWSNCLAVWLLQGSPVGDDFFRIITAASACYIGGMYLNDACDVDFDRQYRPERPIPAGHITLRSVWIWAGLWLLLGLLLILPSGIKATGLGLGLVAAVVVYDAFHKGFRLAPWLMASCRLLLCLVAAAAAQPVISPAVWVHGLVLLAYVAGLSFLARGESGGVKSRRWPLLLLIVPLVVCLIQSAGRSALAWVAVALQVGWTVWALRPLRQQQAGGIGRTVGALLAGIVLVDWAALPAPLNETSLAFVGLFLLARFWQRTVPAT